MPRTAAKGDEAGDGGVRSVERSVAIVTAMASQPAAVSLAEIAAKVELHATTVHRLLSTLSRLGWVEQNPGTLRYRLLPPPLAVAPLRPGPRPLLTRGHGILHRLAAAFCFSCSLPLLLRSKN